MDLIKEAIEKAKASLGQTNARPEILRVKPQSSGVAPLLPGKPAASFLPPEVTPDPVHLERYRVVAYTMKDSTHVVFNQLRTRLYRTLSDNGWKSFAITSPTPGCGKTTVAVNLAISLSRQTSFKTVLLDLDLRRSGVGRMLGVRAKNGLGQYLSGKAKLEDCLVRVGTNLILGLNNAPVTNSADVLHAPRTRDLVQELGRLFEPSIVILDLPPLMAGDDAIAVLPQVDASLLVIASGATTVPEVERCSRECSATNFLGVVLNKSPERFNEYYGYGSY